MKKSILIFVAIVMMAGFSNRVMAQGATVAATPAGAVLLKTMTLTQTAPLHFGSILLSDATGGTVVLPSNSTVRAFTGGLAASAANPATNAAYNVTGTMNETYSLTLPATTTVSHATLSAGVYQMDITSMKAEFANTPGDVVISTLDNSGLDSFTVGGTLTVKANQLGGIYSATFPVTVNYN